MHGTFCTTLCRICIVHMCAEVVFTICVQRCEEALYTRVHFCTIVRSFCTVLRSLCTVLRSSRGRGGGMRRFYTHLQPASWRQFCAILCKGGLHCARVDCTGGDVSAARQPGWMRLQTRPFAVGANLPKHWRDGQSVISFDVKASEEFFGF